jgi:NAD-dependent deacetylase
MLFIHTCYEGEICMYKLVALTGAGISKASGIPTFTEMGDLRNKLSRSYFINHPEDFYKTLIQMKGYIDNAEPNNAHLALEKYNIPVITMNIDGLHKRAGSKNVIEIHGNFEYIYCSNCNIKYDFDIAKTKIFCDCCGKVLQPNVVLYEDDIPLIYEAIDLVRAAKKLLVIGTSFYTSTANTLVYVAEEAGIKVNVINNEAEIEVPIYLDKIFI